MAWLPEHDLAHLDERFDVGEVGRLLFQLLVLRAEGGLKRLHRLEVEVGDSDVGWLRAKTGACKAGIDLLSDQGRAPHLVDQWHVSPEEVVHVELAAFVIGMKDDHLQHGRVIVEFAGRGDSPTGLWAHGQAHELSAGRGAELPQQR
jgi:hypothetical protein